MSDRMDELAREWLSKHHVAPHDKVLDDNPILLSLVALLRRVEIRGMRYGMERAAELANIADMTCPGAAGEYIYDKIDSVCAQLDSTRCNCRCGEQVNDSTGGFGVSRN